MKKLLLLAAMCLMALSMNAQYVDLGLPSGTQWKSENESGGLYTYDQAMEKFGNNLPTKEQLMELKDSCRWTWIGKGYKVEGPNGNFIFLPAEGNQGCNDKKVYDIGLLGGYWSSTLNHKYPEFAWGMYFFPSSVNMRNYNHCFIQSVRLVR